MHVIRDSLRFEWVPARSHSHKRCRLGIIFTVAAVNASPGNKPWFASGKVAATLRYRIAIFEPGPICCLGRPALTALRMILEVTIGVS